MKANPQTLEVEPGNIITLSIQPKPRIPAKEAPQPFRIITFKNASGTESFRVTGHKRDGKRIRENFAELIAAQARQSELTLEWLQNAPPETAARATKLTDDQLRAAEAAFLRIPTPEELLSAVDH